MNMDFKEYFSTRNGKNLENGAASLFKFTFYLRRETQVRSQSWCSVTAV